MSDTAIKPVRDVCPPFNDQVTVTHATNQDAVTVRFPFSSGEPAFENDEQLMFAAICQLVSEYARLGSLEQDGTSWANNWRTAVEAVGENLEVEERLMRGLPIYLTDEELAGRTV